MSALSLSNGEVLGFESAPAWSKSAGTIAATTVHSEGSYGLGVTAPGYTELWSVPLSSLGTVAAQVKLDVRLSASLAWGEARLIVKIPSRGVYWGDLGSVPLTGLSAGTFHTLSFNVGSLKSALEASYSDLTVGVVLNVPATNVVLDRLNFGAAGSPAPVPIGGAIGVALPSSFVLGSVAVAASGDLAINDRAKVLGASGGYAKVVNLGSGTTNIGVESWVGELLSRAPVTLRDRANVAGNVTSNQEITTHANVDIAGASLEHERIERATQRAWLALFDQNAPTVTLASGQSKLMSPGDYGDVTVHAGGTLTLGSGTYNLESLTLGPSSTLIVNPTTGPVVINVRSEFIFRGQLQNRSAVADDLLIGYLGTNMAVVDAPFGGTLVAPNARIKIEGLNGALHYGAWFGKHVEMHQDARLKHVPFAHWDDMPFLLDGSESAASVPFELSASLIDGAYELTYRPVSGLIPDLAGVTINPVQSLPVGDRWEFGDGIGVLIPCHPSPSQPQLDCINPGNLVPLLPLRGITIRVIDRSDLFEDLVEILRCRTFGCPSSLGDEFENDPRYDAIKENLKFQTTGKIYDRFSENIKTPWSGWSTTRSEFPNQPEFIDALEEAWDWLHRSDRFTNLDGQPETALTETGHEDTDGGDGSHEITARDAWKLYLNWVSHNVALDRKGELSWTLAGLAADGVLAPLLDSTEMMIREVAADEFDLGFHYHPNFLDLEVGSYLGSTIIGQPRYTYRFLRQNELVQSSRVNSISSLIDWSRGMAHYYGEDTPENFETHWGHRYFPTVEKIIEGTVRTGENEPRHWTAGCHGTAQFFKDVLRAINIPVRIPVLCGHATLSFPSEGLYIDHGDNPYNSGFSESECNAEDLLVDHDTFWERFGHEGINHDDLEYCEATPDPVARTLDELACVDD